MGISVWCISGIHIVQRHIANPHSIEWDLAHRSLAIGGLGHALLATIEIEPDPAGIARAQGNHRRPGIDQEAHRNAVDRPGGVEMPLIIRRHDDLARAVRRGSADGVLADAQRALLAADFDDDLVALDRDHFHAVAATVRPRPTAARRRSIINIALLPMTPARPTSCAPALPGNQAKRSASGVQ